MWAWLCCIEVTHIPINAHWLVSLIVVAEKVQLMPSGCNILRAMDLEHCSNEYHIVIARIEMQSPTNALQLVSILCGEWLEIFNRRISLLSWYIIAKGLNLFT